jgi:histone H3/H4
VQKTETTLTLDESGRLQSLEAVIERGKQTFIDVGTALMEIRRAKLYRATHSSFESYCVERWGFTRQFASLQIQSAQVAKELSTMVDNPNERTAREFVSVPKEDRPKVAEVAKEVAKEKGRDTINSRDVKEAKAKVYKIETKIEELPPEPDAEPLSVDEPVPTLVDEAGEDWLETLPLRAQLQGTPKRKFDEAAEMWRIFEAPFKLLAAQIRSAHKDVPSHLKSRFFLRQLSSFVIDAPQHWLLCKECNGTGQVPRIGNCSSCSGDGFHASSYKGK